MKVDLGAPVWKNTLCVEISPATSEVSYSAECCACIIIVMAWTVCSCQAEDSGITGFSYGKDSCYFPTIHGWICLSLPHSVSLESGCLSAQPFQTSQWEDHWLSSLFCWLCEGSIWNNERGDFTCSLNVLLLFLMLLETSSRYSWSKIDVPTGFHTIFLLGVNSSCVTWGVEERCVHYYAEYKSQSVFKALLYVHVILGSHFFGYFCYYQCTPTAM